MKDPEYLITIDSVNDALTNIEHLSGVQEDDEAAHEAEDLLWEVVLVAISNGAPNAAELAAAALQTRRLEFSRWYA